MNKKIQKIEIGHIVNVHFNHSDSIFNARVLYIPQGVGDSWHLETRLGLVYVQFFERMDFIG